MTGREFETEQKNSGLAESLLNWYEFRKDADLWQIGSKELSGLFRRRCRRVTQTASAFEEAPAGERYDYIVCAEGIEDVKDPAAVIARWKSSLKPGGVILIGSDNRYGLKYFCGCKEKNTGLFYTGINGYYDGIGGIEPETEERIRQSGRSRSRKEWEQVLKQSGVPGFKFYYPVPDGRMPQMIFTDEYQNAADCVRLIDYNYNDPDLRGVEHRILKDVIESGSLPFLSNAFLIEIAAPERLSDILYAVVTTDRGPERAMATTVRSDGKVYKRPLWDEGERRLDEIVSKTEKLAQAGVSVVGCTSKSDAAGRFLEMPFIQAENLTGVLDRLVTKDRDRFLEIFDEIFEDIKRSASDEEIYLDLAPCNAFYDNGRILYFDQEFTGTGTPGFAMFRTIKYYFASSPKARKEMTAEELFERYGLTKEMTDAFEEREAAFLRDIRKTDRFTWLKEAGTPDYKRICRNNRPDESAEKRRSIQKPYKIGYVPGVFDLFHTGHLRLIERCKERCDHLIVGVLTDELVEYYKGKKPVISLKDRMAVIEGLRDVDEVIVVDFNNTDKLKAWEQLHYDCHFSGDDHAGHWNDILAELKKRGSNMEFFSYTEGISSTMIKERMEQQEH